jgi:hypothetical protein
MIPLLSQETCILLANVCAVDGAALMVRESQPAERLRQVLLNCWEDLVDRFDQEHPELNVWQGDNCDETLEERRDEALDEWLEANFAGCVLEEDDLRKTIENLSSCELATNDEIVYYSTLPLIESPEIGRPALSPTSSIAPLPTAITDDRQIVIDAL